MTPTDLPTTPAAASSIETSELGIQGMTCAACVSRIEKALTKVPGAQSRGAIVKPAEDFRSDAGHGVEARVDEHIVRVGTAGWMALAQIDVSEHEPIAAELASKGRTPSVVAIDGRLAGVLAVADRAAPDARATVLRLRQEGVEVAMITGDRRGTAVAIAAELGIERVFAEMRPADKARVVAEERAGQDRGNGGRRHQ